MSPPERPLRASWRRLGLGAAFLAMTGVISAAVWELAATEALARLAERGNADLALAADRLAAQLRSFHEIAVLMADHPDLAALAAGDSGDVAEVEAILLRVADRSGALDLRLLSADGAVLAASQPVLGAAGGPEVQRAMHGALGFHHGLDDASGRRVFAVAAPIFSAGGPVQGAVVVRIDAERVEAPGRGDPMPVWFSDAEGVVFVSNRSELVLRLQGAALPRSAAAAAIFPPEVLRPMPEMRAGRLAGQMLWRVNGGPYLPARGLLLTREMRVIDMRATALVDVRAALNGAWLQAAVAAALTLVFGAALAVLAVRRQALAAQLRSEARLNASLDARVMERTRELHESNAQLRQAQADLVQAGKLSALGQMSAGISHELNQPLMAIRSYAENAALLLDRGRVPEAVDNLGRISEMARRMGRIIRNLRAFARQEREPAGDVDLVAVVDAALDLMSVRLAEGGVTVDWQRPPLPVMVRGGEVRLQQVVVNLISNAADAMAASAERQIGVSIAPLAGDGAPAEAPPMLRLSVVDTGPGIADPGRIFDPFYSTKEVGSTEGMGLGLSISYSIVQSFGGHIAGRNREGGGAEFTVDLVAAAGGEP